uniref:MFAP1 domain-containing protein n=1 Tax=Soboliphyme baturini TaxID=241478 RepID=A0A183ID81_9BILA
LKIEEAEAVSDKDEEEEESEYEYTDSESEIAPRLKPVFDCRKFDLRERASLLESEKAQQRLKDLHFEERKKAEERRKQSVKLVEDLVRQEIEMEKRKVDDEVFDLESAVTDDENEELAYEQWKVRELRRIKRDKEEREARQKEKSELERVHNMSEEERRAYLRANPKIIDNKQQKGKYKFLQKYFHRGIYKRNFAEPTLEDHFDKTILPKVMQVKNFGKAGRTKWTHLVAEDTTDFQSAWVADTSQNIKFFNKHAAGVKDIFDRPSAKKRKK